MDFQLHLGLPSQAVLGKGRGRILVPEKTNSKIPGTFTMTLLLFTFVEAPGQPLLKVPERHN